MSQVSDFFVDMNWLESLFFEQSPLQAVCVISVIIAVGLGLGKIRICGISLGVTFVFFTGIFAGHLGFAINSDMLKYAEDFGLMLFVYELGLKVGPGFFSSLRQGGMQAQHDRAHARASGHRHGSGSVVRVRHTDV